MNEVYFDFEDLTRGEKRTVIAFIIIGLISVIASVVLAMFNQVMLAVIPFIIIWISGIVIWSTFKK